MNGLRTFASCALSAIAVGTPVWGSVLGHDEREIVRYRRHRWGLGGAVVVCLFGRHEGRWVLQWQEYVFIE